MLKIGISEFSGWNAVGPDVKEVFGMQLWHLAQK